MTASSLGVRPTLALAPKAWDVQKRAGERHLTPEHILMMNTFFRLNVVALGMVSLVACGGTRDDAGRDSAAAAIADSQPGMNAPSDTAMLRNDATMRRDTMSNLSMPIDKPTRGAGSGGQRRP